MEHAAVADNEGPHPLEMADLMSALTDALGLEGLALNYYELSPGESFSGGLHAHTGQEEVFYVIEGEATFETLEDEVPVAADEAIRFAPGEYQEGRNEGDERVRALAFGVPQEQGETRVPSPCPECGDSDYLRVDSESPLVLSCPQCDTEIRP